MTPQERQQFEEMKKKIDNMQSLQDVVFAESLKKRALQDVIEAGIKSSATANENTTTVVPGSGGNVPHAAQYDDRVRVTIDGSDYYIGLYDA